MRVIAAGMGLGMLLAGASAWTQSNPQSQEVASTQPIAGSTSPDYSAVYCSNFVTSERTGDDSYLISGEDSNSKVVFALRDYVYINKGASQGVHVGDRYSVYRPEKDAIDVQWFKWQDKLMKAMGTYYKDLGQLKVVNVQPNVSTAEVTFACDYLQRGDMIRTWQERPSPPYKSAENFDIFAPVSGKSVGMLVVGKEFTQSLRKIQHRVCQSGHQPGRKGRRLHAHFPLPGRQFADHALLRRLPVQDVRLRQHSSSVQVERFAQADSRGRRRTQCQPQFFHCVHNIQPRVRCLPETTPKWNNDLKFSAIPARVRMLDAGFSFPSGYFPSWMISQVNP